MLGIPPEVIEVLTAPHRVCDSGIGVQRSQDALFQVGAVARVVGKRIDACDGGLRLRASPRQRLGTVDIVQPIGDKVSGEEGEIVAQVGVRVGAHAHHRSRPQ